MDAMLVLSRRTGEEIVIDGGIRIRVVSVKGNQVRIGVSAPRSVAVDRQEVAERRALDEALPETGDVIGQRTDGEPEFEVFMSAASLCG
jgi:carbon storage regulator